MEEKPAQVSLRPVARRRRAANQRRAAQRTGGARRKHKHSDRFQNLTPFAPIAYLTVALAPTFCCLLCGVVEAGRNFSAAPLLRLVLVIEME